MDEEKKDKKADLRNLTVEETEDFLYKLGEDRFRGKQIFKWINEKHVSSFDDMTDISKSLRAKLHGNAFLTEIRAEKKLVSSGDSSAKYLFSLHGIRDTAYIESVLMRYAHGSTVCVSTQAGCRMGCAFCASALNGLERNLTAGEMAAQVYEISKDTGERVSNVVLMGSGEPLDNYENVLRFIRLINSPHGLNIGQRHITLSTCGLTDKIYELLSKQLQITLAVSLHAPNDEIRNRLMPVSKRYNMDGLLQACKDYSDKTKRRVTFEYALISGVNDSRANAAELSKRLRNMLCHVNLIPINEIKEAGFKQSSKAAAEAFAQVLRDSRIEVTIRRKLGGDIEAACGQLRAKTAEAAPRIPATDGN